MKPIAAALVAIILMNAPAKAQAFPDIPLAVQSDISAHGLTVRVPSYPLGAGFENSRVPVGDFYAGSYNIETSGLFPLEKSIRDINNTAYSLSVIDDITEGLVADISQDHDILARLIGYHEYVAPSANLVSSNPIVGWPPSKYVLSGRYGQFIEAYCAFDGSRNGLLVLLPGRGADVRAMWGFGLPLDYMNHAASVYHQQTNMNVCALTIYNLPDVPLYRYGLTARGVGLTIIKDFVTWALTKVSDPDAPLFLGGVSNGGHMAELAGILDPRVDGVISAGAGARYDFPLSPYANVSLDPATLAGADRATTPVDMLRSGDIYRLIFPKALLVSIGTHDPALTYSTFPDKFDQIAQAKATYIASGGCLAVNLFLGQHSMDPKGEAPLLNQLLSSCF